MPKGQIKVFRWDAEKNIQLQAEREVSFDGVLQAINDGKVIATIQHPNPRKYPSQKIFIIEMNKYIDLVSFVENDREIFLKTIIPSRKMTQKYLGD